MIAIEFARPGVEDEVARLVNAAYRVGEAGIWEEGWRRIGPDAVGRLVAAGELAVATRDGHVVGCIRIRRLDAETAEFGLLSVAAEAGGTGVATALIEFAEAAHGTAFMQLELLVPRGAPHAHKQRLHDWYSRLGYRQISQREFSEPFLAGPADMRTYRKRLRAA